MNDTSSKTFNNLSLMDESGTECEKPLEPGTFSVVRAGSDTLSVDSVALLQAHSFKSQVEVLSSYKLRQFEAGWYGYR